MRRKSIAGIAGLSSLAALGFAISRCAGDRQYLNREATLTEPGWYGMRNFTVVHVDPNGRPVALHWALYDHRKDGKSRSGWEELTLSSASEVYRITDKGVGNNELIVNGRRYKVRGSPFRLHDDQTLVIRFGEGIAIGPGYPYDKAKHCHESF